MTIRVMIADDHAVVREGLELFLAEESEDFEVVGQAGDGLEAVRMAETLAPDVILMDLVMPGIDGIEATRRIRAAGLSSQVVVLTTFIEQDKVQEALQVGALGYLLKDVLKDDLKAAIRAAMEGRTTLHPDVQHLLARQIAAPPAASPLDALTDREVDVLRLIASGKSNKAIARTLFLSVGTVKGYVSAVLAKLGVNDRTQAALWAVKNGVVDPAAGE